MLNVGDFNFCLNAMILSSLFILQISILEEQLTEKSSLVESLVYYSVFLICKCLFYLFNLVNTLYFISLTR